VRCWAWTWPAGRTAPAGWRSCAAFLARGLVGVQLVTSDSHVGLVEAVGATLPGASWQRCRAARNLATKVPEGAQPWVLTLLRAVFDQPDADQVGAQVARVVEAKFPAAAGLPGTPAALVSASDRQRPNPSLAVFGYHEIWHAFTVLPPPQLQPPAWARTSWAATGRRGRGRSR
jgi:Transposase, Mutator family